MLRASISGSARLPAQESALGAWGLCWSAAIVFSLTSAPGWFMALLAGPEPAKLIPSVALGALAIWVIVRPRPPGWLGLLSVAMLVEVGCELPEVSNHRLILALGAVALLLARTGDGRGSGFDALVPAGRALAVIVYAFAFFAKLNRDFVDPTVSCAVQFYGHLGAWWPFLPAGPRVEQAVILATLVVEGLLPVGLLWPRTRHAAVLLGLAFHLALGFDVTQSLLNFSAVMLALLLLFLPHEFFESFAMRLAREPSLRRILAAWLLAVVLSGLVAAGDWGQFAFLYYGIRQLVWTTYTLVLTGAVVAWHERQRSLVSRPARARLGVCVTIAALATLNGLSPYLGLKTRTAFDMYSNLRLEADRSNHWLVPRSLDVLGLLRDRVKILAADDPQLRRYVETGVELTYFELASRLDTHPGRVEYRRGMEELEVDPGRPSPTPTPPPWWMRKFLAFRPLGESSRSQCIW